MFIKKYIKISFLCGILFILTNCSSSLEHKNTVSSLDISVPEYLPSECPKGKRIAILNFVGNNAYLSGLDFWIQKSLKKELSSINDYCIIDSQAFPQKILDFDDKPNISYWKNGDFDILIYGSIQEVSENININFRIWDTSSGKQLAAKMTNFFTWVKSEQIGKFLAKVIDPYCYAKEYLEQKQKAETNKKLLKVDNELSNLLENIQ